MGVLSNFCERECFLYLSWISGNVKLGRIFNYHKIKTDSSAWLILLYNAVIKSLSGLKYVSPFSGYCVR